MSDFVETTENPEVELNEGFSVICIGSTGTGKSATISKCTRRPVSSHNGCESVTAKCDRYDLGPDAREELKANLDNSDVSKDLLPLVWVDTVGLDDADLQEDSTFKDILQFICDEELLHVKAIIWNILPNVRKDALLTKQASLINLFKPVDIWHNVVIICKQSRNSEDDAQGALAAARQFNSKANPPILGYTYIDDNSLTDNLRRRFERQISLREDLKIKDDTEVQLDVFHTLATLKEPIKVVFKNQRCLDCGITGDSRLMSRYCHMEKVLKHPGSVVQFHPKREEKFHTSQSVIRVHEGGLYRPWFTMHFFCYKFGGKKYTCCKRKNGQPGCRKIRSCCEKAFVEGDDLVSGCQERYRCCRVNIINTSILGCESKYDCCGGKIETPGCREICKKCEKPWGTPAKDCYEKEHNIEPTEPEEPGWTVVPSNFLQQ